MVYSSLSTRFSRARQRTYPPFPHSPNPLFVTAGTAVCHTEQQYGTADQQQLIFTTQRMMLCAAGLCNVAEVSHNPREFRLAWMIT